MRSHFGPSKLCWTKYVQTTSDFCLSKLHRKSSLKRSGYWSMFFFRRIDIISTSNQRRFNVLRPLWTLLFIIPPVVIRFELFESRRPRNPIKLALQSSEKVTLNQLVTRGIGQTQFTKVLDKAEVKSCQFSFM